MTARAPTAFVAYCEELLLQPRLPILTSEIDDVIQQHTFALGKEELLVSEFFPAVSTTSGALVTALKATARVRDESGATALATPFCVWTAYAWASAGVTSFDLTLTDTTTASASTVTVAAALTTASWRAFGLINQNAGNNADVFELQIRVAGGAGTVYVGGLGIFAP